MAKKDDAIEIRDKAIIVAQKLGGFTPAGPMKSLFVERDDGLMISYRTPFQKMPPLDDDTKYRLAQAGKAGPLPYGLDIWASGKKVMNLEWDDDGRVDLVSFNRGPWEATL